MCAKTSQKKLDTNDRYLQKFDRLTFRVRKDNGITKEQIERRAESLGESVNEYINRLIQEDFSKE